MSTMIADTTAIAEHDKRFDRIDIELAPIKAELAMVKWIVSGVGFGVVLLVLRGFWPG